MALEIIEISPDQIQLYAAIPIAYKVKSIYQVTLIDKGLAGFIMTEVKIKKPYVKDYDAYEDGGPERWLKRFDVSNWGFYIAKEKDTVKGGVAVLCNSPDVPMLAGRGDLAILWDIRIHPDFRGHKIGAKLFIQAVNWARERNCSQLMIETQNVNVPACKFYKKLGCCLGAIDRYGYVKCPDVADEVRLTWHYDIAQ